MKNRLAALFMAAVFCMAFLAGCGGNGGSDSSPAPSGGASTDSGGSGNSGGEIKIGILAPLTGDVAEYGTAVRDGARMYLEEVNAAGGVNGKQIVIEEYDEEGQPDKAVTGYNALADKGVTAIIGDVTTAPTLAVVPEAAADNMPMITASATAAAVTVNEETGDVYSNMFRSCFIDPFQGEKMASFANENLSAKTAAVIYNTGSDYSVGCKDAFEATAKELGIEVVASEGYSDDAVDFQSQLTNIASKSPDVLYLPDYYNKIALIAQQAKGAGLDATMIGVDGWDTVLDIVTDASLLEGAYYCSGYSSQDTTEAVQKFLTDFKAKYSSDPNMFSAQGYDAAMILVAAITKAEEAGLEAGSDEYKQAVIDAMKATDMECITGHVTYNETNDPEKSAVIINITDGELKFWGKY